MFVILAILLLMFGLIVIGIIILDETDDDGED